MDSITSSLELNIIGKDLTHKDSLFILLIRIYKNSKNFIFSKYMKFLIRFLPYIRTQID